MALAMAALWVGAGCERQTEPGPEPEPQAANAGSNAITIEYEVLPSILLEAESGAVKAPVKVFEDAAASAGKYVLAPEGPDHKEISIGGDVSYRIVVAEPGEYVLWLRTLFSGACGNSLGVLIDGQDVGKVEDAVFDQWHWVPLRGRRFTLAAGEHSLVLTNREDGAACDQILLTQDGDYRPAGVEAAEKEGRTAGVAVTPAEAAAESK